MVCVRLSVSGIATGGEINWGPQPPKGPKTTRKMHNQQNFLKRCVNSGIAICCTIYALPTGCLVHVV